jgi:hypothetical protein
MNRLWNWRSKAFSLFLACYRGGFLLITKFDPLAGTKILVQAALRRK